MPESKTPKPPPKKKVPHKYTAKQQREGAKLYKEIGPRAASRKLGIPEKTIRLWGQKAGFKPPVANVKACVEAQQAYAAKRRGELAAKLLEEAHDLLGQLHQPVTVYNFGGKDNTFGEDKATEPNPRDKQALLTGIAIAIDKSLVLEKHDSDGGMGLPAVDEWLAHTKGQR